MKKFIKKNLTTILLVAVFTVGLSLLLYPTFSDWFNTLEARRILGDYSQAVAQLNQEDYEKYWKAAEEYNKNLLNKPNRFSPTEGETKEYEATLDVPGSQVMAMIRLPSLNSVFPVMHGTSEATLQSNIGHIEGSSLPVGGPSTHAVLSGHRGLPSAKLFTYLPKLEEGDYFIIEVLDQRLTYQVDKISVVLPEDYSNLQIEPDQDLVTLMTCTPYGINTHRLLVRGHRVDNLPDDFINTRNEAMLIDSKLVALFIAVPVLLGLFIWVMVKGRKKKV